jgi:hypothetical protein
MITLKECPHLSHNEDGIPYNYTPVTTTNNGKYMVSFIRMNGTNAIRWIAYFGTGFPLAPKDIPPYIGEFAEKIAGVLK